MTVYDEYEKWSGIYHITDWVQRVMENDKKARVCRLLMTAWAVWNDRNSVFHGGTALDIMYLVDNVNNYLNSFWEADEHRVKKAANVHQAPVVWRPPPIGWLKVNVDAAVFSAEGCGLGIVIRDEDCVVKQAAVRRVRSQWDPDIAEAKAAEFGLDVGDSWEWAESSSSPTASSYFGIVVKDILAMESHFESIEYCFVNRNGNHDALCMAHLTPIVYPTRVWMDTCPEAIVNFVSVGLISAFSSN